MIPVLTKLSLNSIVKVNTKTDQNSHLETAQIPQIQEIRRFTVTIML